MAEFSRTSPQFALRLAQFALRLVQCALCAPPLLGCEVIHGSGHLIEEERELSKFDRVVIESEAEVTFVQKEERSLTVEAEDNIIGKLVTQVENGALVLGVKSGPALDPTLPVEIRVTGPDLGRISMQGSGTFRCETLTSDALGVDVGGSGSVRLGAVETDELDVQVAGSGDVSIDELDGERVTIDITGAGGVGIAGNADAQNIHIGGLGSYFGAGLETQNVAVDIDGSGDVEVFVQQTLDVSIDGSGSVRFKGNPSVSSLIAGSGSVTPLN